MTIKDLKEIIKDIPDDVEIGYINSPYLSKDILNLIVINTIYHYKKDENLFILAEISRNYLLPTDLKDYKLAVVPEEILSKYNIPIEEIEGNPGVNKDEISTNNMA